MWLLFFVSATVALTISVFCAKNETVPYCMGSWIGDSLPLLVVSPQEIHAKQETETSAASQQLLVQAAEAVLAETRQHFQPTVLPIPGASVAGSATERSLERIKKQVLLFPPRAVILFACDSLCLGPRIGHHPLLPSCA